MFLIVLTTLNLDMNTRLIAHIMEQFIRDYLSAQGVADQGTQWSFSVIAYPAAIVGNSSNTTLEDPRT